MNLRTCGISAQVLEESEQGRERQEQEKWQTNKSHRHSCLITGRFSATPFWLIAKTTVTCGLCLR